MHASIFFALALSVVQAQSAEPSWLESYSQAQKLARKEGRPLAVFVGSGIFKSSDPEARAKAVVKATTHFEDAKAVLESHEELGDAMKGIDVRQLEEKDLLSTRGW